MLKPDIGRFGRERFRTDTLSNLPGDVTERTSVPSFRFILSIQLIRKQGPNIWRKVSCAAFHFCPSRAKIDEPVFEDCSRHCFKRLVHAAVQLDLVVQSTEDMRHSLLRGERRQR